MPLHHRSIGPSDTEPEGRSSPFPENGFVSMSLVEKKRNKRGRKQQNSLISSISIRNQILFFLMCLASVGTLSLSVLQLSQWHHEKLIVHHRKTQETFKFNITQQDQSIPINYQTNSTFALHQQDYEQYTVRVNTWKREKQLKIVLSHLLTCPRVAQIQVVWCSAQGPIPSWLQHPPPKIQIEQHADNSLNARFDALLPVPTAGVLSQDDDVIRPCEAMDAGFALWTMNSNRMVGFDARGHGIAEDDSSHWTYVSLSGTRQSNQYSLALTRFAFLHRDYLASYTHEMPAIIRERVAENLNCEDIAISFWVSALTNGRPPMLADAWAMHTQVALPSDKAISNTSGHKALRHDCINDFAEILHLKERLQFSEWQRSGGNPLLRWGAKGREVATEQAKKLSTAVDTLVQQRNYFAKRGLKDAIQEIHRLQGDAQKYAYVQMLQSFRG